MNAGESWIFRQCPMLKHQVKYDRQNQREVIEELTDLLIQDGAVTNKEDFIRDVWLREELGLYRF